MRRKKIGLLAAMIGLTTVAVMPEAGAAPGDPGCAAAGGTTQASCQFTGSGSANGGYLAASDGWEITHEETDPVTGLPITVVDAAGTAPNATTFVFVSGVLYTVTVTGNGTVAAGAPA